MIQVEVQIQDPNLNAPYSELVEMDHVPERGDALIGFGDRACVRVRDRVWWRRKDGAVVVKLVCW